MSRSTWDPEQYQRFSTQRTQPALDLLALVEPLAAGARVVDLGCGPGHLTAMLADRFERASVEGVDCSDTMLERAKAIVHPRVRWSQADIAEHPIESADLVFSNAALHWVANHRCLFSRLRDGLASNGQLAIQMPDNFAQPTHTIAASLAGTDAFAEALGGRRSGAKVESLEWYAKLLHELGFARQLVQHRIYLHELPDREAVFEWVRGSMLSWYRAELGSFYPAFEQAYREQLLTALPNARPFVLAYRRILLWASLTSEGAQR